MANDHIPRPNARFHGWQSNFVTYVNGHLADSGLAAGVMGAETCGRVAWASRPRSCDPPPTGPSELSLLSVATRTPHVIAYRGEDGGKTAHYMLRRVGTTGEKGPWSETASATIGA